MTEILGRTAVEWLTAEDPAALFAEARRVRAEVGRAAVLPRALIEVSNICAKDCLYCGIRKSQRGLTRYRLGADEVTAVVDEALRQGYRAVAFQSGEIAGDANTAFYERLLAHCRGKCEVTLSLGEQTEEVYRRWKAAFGDGVLRYLIRIETSDPELYAAIHPSDCVYARRVECIRTLKRLGYVTGSGVMIGLPGQTPGQLAADLDFFAAERLDMVGMGPYIPAEGTPLAASPLAIPSAARRLDLALRMIALARIRLRDVNIVAATALEALDADGRAKGLAAGANVVMPRFTPEAVAADYFLYPFANRRDVAAPAYGASASSGDAGR